MASRLSQNGKDSSFDAGVNQSSGENKETIEKKNNEKKVEEGNVPQTNFSCTSDDSLNNNTNRVA